MKVWRNALALRILRRRLPAMRDRAVLRAFDGRNYDFLVEQFNLTERGVRKALARALGRLRVSHRCDPNSCPAAGATDGASDV